MNQQRTLSIRLATVAFLPLGLLSVAAADEWIILGTRAMGMGGAGVATVRGGYGMYWNPASLGMSGFRAAAVDNDEDDAGIADSTFDVEVPATLTLAAVGDVLPTLSTAQNLVENLDFDNLETKFNAGTLLTDTEVQDSLRLLTKTVPALNERGNGAAMTLGVGAGARLGRFGLTTLALGYAGARPVVDLGSLLALGDGGLDDVIGTEGSLPGRTLGPQSQALADALAGAGLAGQNQAEEIVHQAEQAGLDTSDPTFQSTLQDVLTATQANDGGSIANAFTNNDSGVRVRGILMTEVGLGYAIPFGDWLSVGASARLIYATTYFKPFSLDTLQDAEETLKDLTDFDQNTEESFNVGLDVGVLFRPLDWLVVGATGKNLNQPRFEMEGDPDWVLDPQLRLGAAVHPFDWLTLAADIDAFTNHSEALPGYDTQFAGGGAELRIWDTLFLRGGVSKNLADPDEDILIHAGVSFRVWYFSIDASAAVTPSVTNLNTSEDLQEVPERAGASIMVGFNVPL